MKNEDHFENSLQGQVTAGAWNANGKKGRKEGSAEKIQAQAPELISGCHMHNSAELMQEHHSFHILTSRAGSSPADPWLQVQVSPLGKSRSTSRTRPGLAVHTLAKSPSIFP